MKRAYLGVAIQPIDQELAKQFGVQTMQGVVIADVQPDTPAAAAGVKPGDVVVEFAGKPVSSPQELQQAVDQAPIGQKATARRGARRKADDAGGDCPRAAGRLWAGRQPLDDARQERIGRAIRSSASKWRT